MKKNLQTSTSPKHIVTTTAYNLKIFETKGVVKNRDYHVTTYNKGNFTFLVTL